MKKIRHSVGEHRNYSCGTRCTRWAGDDVLQLLRSNIRLNSLGPIACTRIRYWISESRISDTITNTGGVRGGEAPSRTGTGGPNSVEAHHPLFRRDPTPDRVEKQDKEMERKVVGPR
jgi:hypothetical protein